MVKEKVAAVKRRTTPIKIRTGDVYKRKVERMTKWHNGLMEWRKEGVVINPNTKLLQVRRELKPLDFYTGKIKVPNK